MQLQPQDKPIFAVLTHDKRDTLLCRHLREQGYTVHTITQQTWQEEGAQALPQGSYFIVRSLSEQDRAHAAQRNVVPLEYFLHEPFHTTNSAITAENAIQIALEHLDTALQHSRALVIGYGRIGAPLVRMLQGLGAQTHLAARSEQARLSAAVFGVPTLSLEELDAQVGGFDVLFNTVPHRVLPESVLQKVAKHCVLIDLASAPGGIDWEAAERLELRAIQALALPGKLTPRSAALTVWQAVRSLLQQKGVNV